MFFIAYDCLVRRLRGELQILTVRELEWIEHIDSYGKLSWLVVWNMLFFHSVGNVIIPIDFYIVQRG